LNKGTKLAGEKNMLKAGIITGVIGIIFGIGITLALPICVPCITVFLGVIAGFLAGVFDQPGEGSQTMKTGALAGLVAGILLAFGQIIGTGINSIFVGPESANQFLESFGMYSDFDSTFYYVIMACSTMCFGLIDIILMTGFGFLGALIWGVFLRKNDPISATEMGIN
jgi:hypothetical protein